MKAYILIFFLTFSSILYADAADLCYEPIEESGFSMGPVDIMYTTKIPIRNINDTQELTNVSVAIGSESLFSLMDECGIDDVEGNCETESGAEIFVASAFNEGIVYDLDSLDSQELKTPYSKSMFSLFSNDDYDIVGTYVKNGQTYTGVIDPCPVNTEETNGERDFILRQQNNLYGDVKVLGNTILCKLNDEGQCVEPTDDNSNADTDLQKAPVSSATLTLPDGATVVYARLYWQGREKATTTNQSWTDDLKTKAKTIKIKEGNLSNYTTYTADIADFSSVDVSYSYYHYTYNRYVRIYHASVDVSNFVSESGTFYVDTDSFETYTGKSWDDDPDEGLGAYGAWTLVVVYEDLNGEYRNVSIFDGYKVVSSDSDDVDVSVSGFFTPRSGDVDSQSYVFTAEGDKYIEGDHIYMSGKDHPSDPMVDLGTFDSSIDVDAPRDPNLINNNGIDIRAYNVGTSGEDIIKNEETGAEFKFTSTGDTYFPSLIVFSTELYVPRFCYDYSYKQQDIYFTEENNGSHLPYINGDVFLNEDVDVTVFIRNLVDSDINISDMSLNILDINTSQAIYKRETTMLAKGGETIPTAIEDSSLDVSDSYIKDIPIGSISSNDFFYLYYTLTPNSSPLDMLLNAQASYTLTFNGTSIPYTLQLGKDMQLCSTSNFKYTPANGMFNIVHNNYYQLDTDENSDLHYYNLPTQVTAREGNFKLLVLDPSDPDYNTLLDEHNILYTEVEMIDASAFHDTNASCYEPTSSISEKVGLYIDENVTSVPFNKTALLEAIDEGRTTLTTSSEFYKTARQNAAFRTTYYENVYDQYNQPAYKKTDDNVYEAQWDMDWEGSNCVGDVNDNGESNNNDKVSNYCQDGHGLNSIDLIKCTKCVSVIKYICSRDNFSIRPEAFLLQIDDQNQSNSAQQSDITTLNNSGSAAASAPRLHLAADYNYNLEINATNHVNNNASYGYTRSFNIDNTAIAAYKWEPESTHDVSGCNAPNDVNISMRFLNGRIDINTSLENVGAYKLNLYDKSWTLVDYDPNFMIHHVGSYFLDSDTPDCQLDSDIVLDVNTNLSYSTPILNGCEIRSQHQNNEANLQYNDYNITFHPYKFDMSTIIPSVGTAAIALSNTSYIYYSDVFQTATEPMSYHLKGIIQAKGYNNASLNNFVNQCYATGLNLSVTTTTSRDLNDTEGNSVAYRAKFHDKNASGIIQSALDLNATDTHPTQAFTIQTTQAHFIQNSNGAMDTELNLNYEKRKDKTVNPKALNFILYQADCTLAISECTFKADLTTKTSHGEKDLNSSISIRHYYGRTHAPRQRFVGQDGNVSLYYEVFCYGNTCNKNLLQDGVASTTTDDPRWFINTKHSPDFGLPGDANQKTYTVGNGNVIQITKATGTYPDHIEIQYNENRGYPYKTTMENNASQWLIYNPFNANAQKNEFEVEFTTSESNWGGKRETDSNTNRNASDKTNRRTIW